MKTILNTTLTTRATIIITISCLLFLGLLLFVTKGCNSSSDTSNLIHPYISEKELKSTEPIAVDPFPEPSLESLVTQLKSELGLTETEIAKTAEMIAEERLFDNINYMDSRRDANSRQAAWDRRKRLVVAKPELLWTPGFILPPTLDVMELKDNALYDYKINYSEDIKLSKSQEERMDNLREQDISDLEYARGGAAILAESYTPLTIAKLSYSYASVGDPDSQVGMEYAELAIRENPDSFEAHHVWALCNRLYYFKTDKDKVVSGFRQLVERFPNSSIAHFDLSWNLPIEFYSTFPIKQGSVRQNPYVEEALGAIQRAIQLDDRIEPNNETLAACYVVLGEYEKALAVYQGMSEVYYGHGGGLVFLIHQVQDEVYKQRQQQGE